MPDSKDFSIKITGISNGSSSYQAKNDKFYHSFILLVPGEENNLKIELNDSSPTKFESGTPVSINVKPRFWNGKFAGLQEA